MAQSCGQISMPISDVTSRLTIKITGLRGFALRLKIAAWLFRLGARIAGVGIVIEA
jgi:hypothetical protein